MREKDYYKSLGVSPDASAEQIKKAYRALALKYHPDRTQGDTKAAERFKEINEAYQTLNNAEKRQQYDAFRQGYNPFVQGFGARASRGDQAPFGGSFEGFSFEDLGGVGGVGDIFESIFGGRRTYGTRGTATQPARGPDVETELTVPFEIAAQGGERKISILGEQLCTACKGSGAAVGGKVTTCPRCKGQGTVLFTQGGFGVSRTCPECLGRGEIISSPCPQCQGSGRSNTRRTFKVRIPAGLREGQRIRLAGEGEPGYHGGPPGDLFVRVHVGRHPQFERKNGDIYSQLTIDLSRAVLGGRAVVRTLDGTVSVTIPAGTQPGSRLRLKGKGIQQPGGRRGDHYVIVSVEIPRRLSTQQRNLFEQFASSIRHKQP